MTLDDLLNDPNFQFDGQTVLLKTLFKSLFNQNLLISALKSNIRLLEIQKGLTGQELDDTVEEKLQNVISFCHENALNDLIQDLN